MTKAHGDAPATYYRLSEESWAEIRREYRNGATARELAGKWRVSASSIYRRACEGGWGKKTDGDALAHAHAAAVTAEAQADLQGAWPGTRGGGMGAAALAELVPGPVTTEMPDDALDLARAAVEASGRAMRLGRLAEAQGLGKLAEMFARQADRDPDGRLMTVYFAALTPGWADRVMSTEGEDEPSIWKRMYWAAKARGDDGFGDEDAPKAG